MCYTFGDYVLDTQRQELHHAGEPVKLRRKVFQVLVYLLAYRERVVPKQELLEHLWPDQFVGDEALKSCMKALRQALGERGRRSRFLHTVHGQGYRFVAAVVVREPLPADGEPPALPLHEAEGATHQAELPSPALAPPLTDPGSILWEALEGEHKQVTVLCVALAEALTLAARLGPEAMHHLMRDVLASAQATVQRYEGTLLQVSGEGFLALFGAPVAQEDHARRAVLAGLDLCQRLRTPEALRGQPRGVALRLGLASGPMVVGPLVHEPQRPYAAMGDTLSLATWLQQRATPDTLLVSAATYALVQDEVQGEACEPLACEAPSASMSVYTIHDLKRRRAGVPRRGARPLSRFVGRTQELTLLHERLAHAVSGQGQVIGIVGEPGLGKSRLLAEFAHRLDGQAVTYCEGHCLAYSSATSYLPLRDLLRQLWGLPDTAAPDAITATVQQWLREAGVASEAETLLVLQFLDVPVDLAPLAALAPPERKARTFALLRHVMRQASQRLPLVLAVENLHWSDPTSEEWLATLVEQLGDLPVLLLVTARPGYQPPWLGHAAATQIALPRLSRSESLTVLHSVPQAAQLTVSLHQAIVTKAAGNPFFVEELTWAAVAHGVHAGTLPLPDTIEAVLAARIDRLPPEDKRLLQIAAVIGTEVPVPLVQRLAGLPADTVQRGLAHLQAAEFLYETRLFPEQAYTFKHALTHEVAYGSLLLERRRVLHARIVESLEALAPERVERLAHHALRGELREKAVHYLRQAGLKATARSALLDARVWFEQALGGLEALPESQSTLEQAFDIRLELWAVLHHLGDPRRGLERLREAETVAERLHDDRRRGRAYAFMTPAHGYFGELDEALASGTRALAIAGGLGDLPLRIHSTSQLEQAHYYRGEYERVVELATDNLAALPGDRPYESFGSFAPASVFDRFWLVVSLAELGRFAPAAEEAAEAIRLAESTQHASSVSTAYHSAGVLPLLAGDWAKARSLLEHSIAVARAGNHMLILPLVVAASAWVLAQLGEASEATGRLREGEDLLERYTAWGHVSNVAWACYQLGHACLLLGRLDEAQHLGNRALASAPHHPGFAAHARHLLGDIATHPDRFDAESGEAQYSQALALAEPRSMRPLVAHCHRGLGTLYAQTGRRAQARAALSTAIALYRAMDMTFWLPQAEAMLAHIV